jgi:hypothetical protein
MTDINPDRVWTVEVRRMQDGYVEIREGDLDFRRADDDPEPTWDQLRELVEKNAEAQARSDGRHVEWVDTTVELHETRWN